MRLRTLLIIMCLAIAMIPIAIIGGLMGMEIATATLASILLVTFCVSYISSYFILRPLEKLTKSIDEISKGNLDIDLERGEINEINTLTESLNRVMASLKLAIHKVGVKKGEIFEETMNAKEIAERRYLDLLNTIDDWVWEVDHKGVYTFCSPKVADALGYNPEEIIGKTIFDFVPERESKKLKTLFNEQTKNHEPITKLENIYVHKNGKTVHLLTRATPIFDKKWNFCGYRGIHRTISTHQPLEHKLEELIQKNIKSKIVKKECVTPQLTSPIIQIPNTNVEIQTQYPPTELSYDYMFIFNEQGKIIDSLGKTLEILGYYPEEVVNLHLDDVDLFGNKDDLHNKINEIKTQGRQHFKTIHKRKDGSSLLVSETIHFLKEKSLFQCFVKLDTL